MKKKDFIGWWRHEIKVLRQTNTVEYSIPYGCPLLTDPGWRRSPTVEYVLREWTRRATHHHWGLGAGGWGAWSSLLLRDQPVLATTNPPFPSGQPKNTFPDPLTLTHGVNVLPSHTTSLYRRTCSLSVNMTLPPGRQLLLHVHVPVQLCSMIGKCRFFRLKISFHVIWCGIVSYSAGIRCMSEKNTDHLSATCKQDLQ